MNLKIKKNKMKLRPPRILDIRHSKESWRGKQEFFSNGFGDAKQA